MGFLLKRLKAPTRRLPDWLRLPVIGGCALAAILAVRLLIAVVAERAPGESRGQAALVIAAGFAAGFAAGLVTFVTWRATRPLGRLGYAVTGACTLVAYMFAICILVGKVTGQSAVSDSTSVLPDTTGAWLLFILYPTALGAIAGWFKYSRDTAAAKSDPATEVDAAELPSCFVKLHGQSGFTYCEGDRSITGDSETLATEPPRMVIWSDSIGSWDPPDIRDSCPTKENWSMDQLNMMRERVRDVGGDHSYNPYSLSPDELECVKANISKALSEYSIDWR